MADRGRTWERIGWARRWSLGILGILGVLGVLGIDGSSWFRADWLGMTNNK